MSGATRRATEPLGDSPAERDDLEPLFTAALGIPSFPGNRVDVLRNGDRIFPAMLEAIEAAERTIELLTFIYWTGDVARRFADALSSRARAGVATKLILDGAGALPMPRDLLQRMETAGVEVRWFRPPVRWKVWQSNNRTHRKVLVCDSHVGFTGGVGIAEEWEGDARHPGEWRDTHFRIRGPALRGLQAAFWGNWLEAGGRVEDVIGGVRRQEHAGEARVLPLRATASVGWSDTTAVHHLLIAAARERIRITSAYFVPTAESVRLLRDAAARGVEVTVLVPGPHIDHRVCRYGGEARYEPLLEAGVRILHYQPTMLHTKCITVDGEVASIGSANFNYRSMSEDDEVLLLVFHPPTVAELDEDFERDVERSRSFDLEAWKRRPARRRAKQWLARRVRRHI